MNETGKGGWDGDTGYNSFVQAKMVIHGNGGAGIGVVKGRIVPGKSATSCDEGH